MKKAMTFLLVLSLLLALSACGASEPDPNEGTYTGVYGTAYGLKLAMEELYEGGFNVTLKGGGRCVFTISGEDYNGRWKLEGTTFTATFADGEFTGTLSDGVLVLKDFELEDGTADFTFINYENPKVTAMSTEYLTWWDTDWYGWWIVNEGTGAYEEWGDGLHWWDCCAKITTGIDGTASIMIWDEDCAEDETIVKASLKISEGGTHGTAVSESGTFYTQSIAAGEWLIDPDTAAFEGQTASDLLKIDGSFTDTNGSFTYNIYLRPWGTLWDDVDETWLPYYYAEWYLPLLQNGVENAPYTIGTD